jgi:ComF family protein
MGGMESGAADSGLSFASTAARGFGALIRSGMNVVLPTLCLGCEMPVASAGTLCAQCWGRLSLIERPFCERLGTPFSYDLGEGALSAEAIADPPPFERLRAVAAYSDMARKLVQALKYGDRLDLARWMARWMVRAGGEFLPAAAVVVPVPLHRRRLWSRRFNQSAMLAMAIAEAAGKPFAPTVLRRIRPTRQQVGLSARERADNVRGAFRVAEGERIAIAGRRVLLVDDVYTTGATMKAASRALLRAGAVAVDAVVFARVVRS